MDFDPQFDYVEPYDCTDSVNEPRPDSVVYQPVFEKLTSNNRRVGYILRDTLANSTYQNSVTRGLIEELKKRSKEDANEQTMFAISGDMAAGKSSVINSILSIGTIARKGAGGGSCTWVVQRFMKKFPDQNSPFAAKVTFFGKDEIRSIMASMLSKYFRATNAASRNNSDDEEDDAEIEALDSTSENYSEVKTVMDAFLSLFCDDEDFMTDEGVHKYLRQAASEDDEDIIDDLARKAWEIVDDHLEGQEAIVVEAATTDDLLFRLQPYTHRLLGEEGTGQVAPWPLVNVVDFGFDNALLNENIVLVDTPGLSDSNSARARNAMAHHRQCTHKITVADISRAKDDKSLRDNLAEGYARRGGGGTILVLTRGDSIDDDTEVTGTIAEKRKEQQLRQDLKGLRDSRKKLMAQKRKASREEGLDLMDEIESVGESIKAKDRAFQALCVGMRNSSVVKAVSDQYRDMTGDAKPLSAFVVGNDAYKKYQAGHDTNERPVLSVEETGIPALRARLYVLPAEGKLNDALHMAKSQIPNMINLIELYCGKTHFARKSEIEALILEPCGKIPTQIEGSEQKVEDAMSQYLLKPMHLIETHWVSEARKLCQRWARPERFLNTHLTLMKNNGFRKGTKKKPEVNWNKDLLSNEKIKETMDTCFGNLQDELLPILAELKHKLMDLLLDARRSIKSDPQFNVMALGKFLDAFNMEKITIQHLMEKAYRDIRAGLHSINVDATTASATSYLVRAMDPIYKEVIQVKGRGAPAKRMELFEKRVASMSGIWMCIHDNIAKAFGVLLTQQLQIVENGMNEIINSIHNKFNVLCDDTEVKDAEEKLLEEELREKLQKAIIQAKDLLEGPIREAADECSKYSTRKKDSLFVGDDESSNGD